MKKFIGCVVFAIVCGTVLFAQNYRDGIYFAQDANFASNQKSQVVIQVKDGKIASVNWNIISLNAGMQDLKSMVAAGAAPNAVTWVAQAKAAEDFLVSSQNVNAASVPNGPANVKPFFDLVKNALKAKAVAKGSYGKDGWFYAEESETDDYHAKNSVLITVVNGTIVDVLWNGILQGMPASVNPSKHITSLSNGGKGYPMTGSKRPWHDQSNRTAEALLKAQDPGAIKVKPDHKPDGISGVTIEINHFIAASRQALQSAR